MPSFLPNQVRMSKQPQIHLPSGGLFSRKDFSDSFTNQAGIRRSIPIFAKHTWLQLVDQ
jgi:hypothetical protein